MGNRYKRCLLDLHSAFLPRHLQQGTDESAFSLLSRGLTETITLGNGWRNQSSAFNTYIDALTNKKKTIQIPN